MLRYLIFITIGILLYLLLNIYNTFSIGVPTYYFVPYTEGMTTIDVGDVIEVTTESTVVDGVETLEYYDTNTFQLLEDNQWDDYDEEPTVYWVTTIDPETQENRDTILRDINNEVTPPETPPETEPETEQERQERIAREREIQERQERERIARIQFLNMMQESDDNLFKDGDIVIFTDNTGYRELQITTFNLTGDARGGMTDDPILLPSDLPGYRPPGANRNSPRMYFVVRPITLVNFWRTRTTTYTIVGFGGQNTHNTLSGGAYIQEVIDLNRFVPISNINLVLDGFEERLIRRRYIDLLDTLQDEFNRIHNPDDRRETRLDVTDYIRRHVYGEGEPCAAIAEDIPPP